MESLQGRDETLLFSNFFFPIFFYILSLVSRRCGWGRSFNVWNSSFRSKNGELGRSVGFWNRLSAPWTCIIRYLKMVHGANQREPRWFFLWPRTVENASAVPSVLFISTRSRSVNVHSQDRAVQRVQRITTHSGVHIRQNPAWRLAATQKTQRGQGRRRTY